LHLLPSSARRRCEQLAELLVQGLPRFGHAGKACCGCCTCVCRTDSPADGCCNGGDGEGVEGNFAGKPQRGARLADDGGAGSASRAAGGAAGQGAEVREVEPGGKKACGFVREGVVDLAIVAGNGHDEEEGCEGDGAGELAAEGGAAVLGPLVLDQLVHLRDQGSVVILMLRSVMSTIFMDCSRE
jgi:hypothetical protein